SETAFIALFVGAIALVVIVAQMFLLNSRVSGIERTQESGNRTLSQALVGVQTVQSVQSGLSSDLAVARDGLSKIQGYAEARQDLERSIAESIRNLELVIRGTYSKGIGGENLLEIVLSQLPADWRVQDFRVRGKQVEFGLRLPNKLVLPIDSKW